MRIGDPSILSEPHSPNRAAQIRDAVIGAIPEELLGDGDVSRMVYADGQIARRLDLSPREAAEMVMYDLRDLVMSREVSIEAIAEAEKADQYNLVDAR